MFLIDLFLRKSCAHECILMYQHARNPNLLSIFILDLCTKSWRIFQNFRISASFYDPNLSGRFTIPDSHSFHRAPTSAVVSDWYGCCKHSFEQNLMKNGKWNSKNIKTAGFWNVDSYRWLAIFIWGDLFQCLGKFEFGWFLCTWGSVKTVIYKHNIMY